ASVAALVGARRTNPKRRHQSTLPRIHSARRTRPFSHQHAAVRFWETTIAARGWLVAPRTRGRPTLTRSRACGITRRLFFVRALPLGQSPPGPTPLAHLCILNPATRKEQSMPRGICALAAFVVLAVAGAALAQPGAALVEPPELARTKAQPQTI